MKWLAIAALLASGCFEDECDDGESVCGESNQKVGCYEGGFVSPEGCCAQGTTCMQTGDSDVRNRKAACSASGALDPRCEGLDWRFICDGNTLVKCEYGFASGEEQCGACVERENGWGKYGVCAMVATDARCARFAKPKPEGCDGDVLFTCNEGALVSETNCGALGASCRETPGELAQCFVANDPVCDGELFEFCDGNIKNICAEDGTRVPTQCRADQTCQQSRPDHAFLAWCEAPVCE
jgi:hypothetical protein